MGKAATNLTTFLGIIAMIAAGYYIYTQKFSPDANLAPSEQDMQKILSSANAFIQETKILDSARLDTSIFVDERFTTLESFSTPIQELPVGRMNPFEDTEQGASNHRVDQ